MTDVRLCWYCDAILVAAVTEPGQKLQHCGSGSCHWCMDCERDRRAGLPLKNDRPRGGAE